MISDDTIKRTICKNIAKYRKLAGLNQKEFASKLGAAPSRVSSWETGANSTDIDTLFKICEILNVSINDMCEIYPDANVMLSYFEQEHIKKYRNLDDFGKKIVDTTLNIETERTNELRNQQKLISEQKKQLSDQQDQIDMLKQRIVTEIIRRLSLPFYAGLASAGSGEYLFDDIPTDMIEVEDTPTARKADFVIGVNGDSMEPDFYDGERVFVKKTADLNVGDVGIFIKGCDCYIKELGDDRLISRNKAYKDIPADEEIRTVGKVIGKVEYEDGSI